MSVRLTQTVQKGGCAAKIAASTLREVLSSIDLPNKHEDLLVSGEHLDDAAVYRVSDELAMVSTLDFFTPIVDTPEVFGRIAAANALSDVYAMGGIPKTCLAILAFPLATLGTSIMTEILAGACAVVRQADALLVGGHSIDDDTIKFGLSVTGQVHPKKIWTNQGAKPGDDLILTKGLGTGTLCAGLKRGAFSESDINQALDSMMTLNNVSAHLCAESLAAIHGATDITGFGLLGHSMQMAQASHVSMVFEMASIPILQKARLALESGYITKAHRSNAVYTDVATSFAQSLNVIDRQLLCDPQTSGGLLLAVDPQQTSSILEQLSTYAPLAQKVGTVRSFDGGHSIYVG